MKKIGSREHPECHYVDPPLLKMVDIYYRLTRIKLKHSKRSIYVQIKRVLNSKFKLDIIYFSLFRLTLRLWSYIDLKVLFM